MEPTKQNPAEIALGTALMRAFRWHKASTYFPFDEGPPADLRIECGNAAIAVGEFEFAAKALKGTSERTGLRRIGEWYEEKKEWWNASEFYQDAKATEQVRALGFKLINLSREKQENEEKTDEHAKLCMQVSAYCFSFLKDKHEWDNVAREMMYRGMYEEALTNFKLQKNMRQLRSCAGRMIDRKMLTDDLWLVCKYELKDKPMMYAYAYAFLWHKERERQDSRDRLRYFLKTVRDCDLEDQVSVEDLRKDTLALLSKCAGHIVEEFALTAFEFIVKLESSRKQTPTP